jgi:hypothetical protein
MQFRPAGPAATAMAEHGFQWVCFGSLHVFDRLFRKTFPKALCVFNPFAVLSRQSSFRSPLHGYQNSV